MFVCVNVYVCLCPKSNSLSYILYYILLMEHFKCTLAIYLIPQLQ